MNDVTAIFETYRECARHISNTYFSTRDNEDWDIISDFNAVASVLLERLVLAQLPEEHCCSGYIQAEIKNIIKDNKIRLVPVTEQIPVMISRDNTCSGNRYWDHPINQLGPNDSAIAFHNYFDWNQFDLIDFRYYLGTIISSSKYPEIVGHQILIETIYAKVMYEARLQRPNGSINSDWLTVC